MRLKIKYILFISALLFICLLQSYFIFEQHKIIFMLAEVLIILCAAIAVNLYKQLIQPISTLKQGVAAIRDQDFNVKFVATGQQEVDELVEVYNRMIDALRIERTTQQEQHFFLEKLIQTSPTAIMIMDFDGAIKQVNPKAKHFLRSAPALADHLHDLEVGNAKTIRIDGLHTFKIQKSKFIDRGFERQFIMMEEVTAEIFEAEKNVYSKVIRMMAHEVNNTVGPVNSIIGSALDQKDFWSLEEHQMLQHALQIAIERNQNLNSFMRNFADLVKLPPANKQQVDLCNLIKTVSSLMQYAAAERQIEFVFDLPKHAQVILADVQQLEQALLNVVKNAMEAIGMNGTIEFLLDPVNCILKITDDGGGISAADREILFTPFFSTKKDGQGIGLTLVREVCLNHGFDFSLKTLATGKTVFSINMK
jgi:two-component system nitrogen regulation sensor histidine kinase NtrY